MEKLVKISTNVQQELTIAVLMLCVITPKEHSTASANKGIRETDTTAQISTNVQQELTIAVLMLCVITPKEHSTASANKGMRETDTIAQDVKKLSEWKAV